MMAYTNLVFFPVINPCFIYLNNHISAAHRPLHLYVRSTFFSIADADAPSVSRVSRGIGKKPQTPIKRSYSDKDIEKILEENAMLKAKLGLIVPEKQVVNHID